MRPLTPLVAACLLAVQAQAEHDHALEEVTVEGIRPVTLNDVDMGNINLPEADSAQLLTQVPGANVNSNGPLTGIAQYRGMYGDRVNVALDGAPVLSGGPNAMDAPLSYASPGLLGELVVHRGIAPVSAGLETLGGHIKAGLNRGQFSNTDTGKINGFLNSQYNANGERFSSSAQLVAANKQHKLAVIGSYDDGKNLEAGDSETITGTHYERQRYDVSYAWHFDSSHGEIYTGRLDTTDSGTPALPMDINFIDTRMSGINLGFNLGEAHISANLHHSEVEHIMDNFSFRRPPATPMMHRSTYAEGDGLSWSLIADWQLPSGKLSIGHDAKQTTHDATISNPNNAMFEILNFTGAERDVYGVFVEWQSNWADWSVESGLRFNRVAMNSDPVSASGLMGMMGTMVGQIAQRFNSGELDKDYHYVDAVLKFSRPLTSSLLLQIDLGQKNRAPSFQERYLWLPMPATAGLADGRSYTGNLNLQEETAREIDLGLQWSTGRFTLAPQLFYRRVDNYIQGVPSSNMQDNMLSQMMSGNPALSFANVDAEIFGFDASGHFRISEHWASSAVFSYVRGKRRDNDDELYRIAPANLRLALHYQNRQFAAQLENVLYSAQNKVSAYNDEQASAGYGLLNLSASWQASKTWQLRAGVSNLLDKRYANHLAGYNRNGSSEQPLGSRIAGIGRESYIAVQFNW